MAVQLDACLNKWESKLPSEWKLHNLLSIEDNKIRAQRQKLHLRLLHTRIFLHRPTLAQFYLRRCSRRTVLSKEGSDSLENRLLRECAGLCIESARSIVSLVTQSFEMTDSIGTLPWWYRIYYLHIAGMTFLAAMFVPELYTEAVSQSWHSLMSTLYDHQHLSSYVQQCVCTFQTLSSRILEPRSFTSTNKVTDALGDLDFAFDDLFYDAGPDFTFDLFSNNDAASS